MPEPNGEIGDENRSRKMVSGIRIGIPAINRGDLMEKCVNSIDYPVEKLLIVANRWGDTLDESVAAAIDRLSSHRPHWVESIEIREISGNLGDSGSFNYIISELGPCIVASNDTEFTPGTLRGVDQFIKDNPDCVLHYLFAMCAFGVTQAFIERVGYFDENCWPWGWCDIDISYRLQKYNHKTRILPNTVGRIVHDHPTQSIKSAPDKLRKWMLKMASANDDYGIKKWGLRQEDLFAKNKSNKWAMDPAILPDIGQAWALDIQTRRDRIESLTADTGIEAPLVFCKQKNTVS
jgi:hypothetical protein